MPQIWMTYDELADVLGCTPEQARDRVRAEGLDRKISRDGHKRVKLNLPLIGLFFDRVRSQTVILDSKIQDLAIEDLRGVHAKMLSYEEPVTYEPDPDLFDVAEQKTASAA